MRSTESCPQDYEGGCEKPCGESELFAAVEKIIERVVAQRLQSINWYDAFGVKAWPPPQAGDLLHEAALKMMAKELEKAMRR